MKAREGRGEGEEQGRSRCVCIRSYNVWFRRGRGSLQAKGHSSGVPTVQRKMLIAIWLGGYLRFLGGDQPLGCCHVLHTTCPHRKPRCLAHNQG